MSVVLTVAYHFVGATLRDGRLVPPDGEWLEHDGPLEMCASGLHASLHPFDALQYAPGPVLCLVELDGTIVRDDDKVVASRRRIVRRCDVTDLLRAFARQVRDAWYLETGDERHAALVARTAAWEAARAAALAAGDDAWESTWDATRDAQRTRFADLVNAKFSEGA